LYTSFLREKLVLTNMTQREFFNIKHVSEVVVKVLYYVGQNKILRI